MDQNQYHRQELHPCQKAILTSKSKNNMTLNTCIAFPAHRDWTNGPRKLHLTKKIEIEIDHVYENIFALSFADPTGVYTRFHQQKHGRKVQNQVLYQLERKIQ